MLIPPPDIQALAPMQKRLGRAYTKKWSLFIPPAKKCLPLCYAIGAFFDFFLPPPARGGVKTGRPGRTEEKSRLLEEALYPRGVVAVTVFFGAKKGACVKKSDWHFGDREMASATFFSV